MAEQSTATVTIRALIMLSCVIVIPLVALFGTSLPEHLKSFFADSRQPATDDKEPNEAPPFRGPEEAAAGPASGQFASSPFGPNTPRPQESHDFHAATRGEPTPGSPPQWGQSADSQAWDAPRSRTNAVPVGYTSDEPSFRSPAATETSMNDTRYAPAVGTLDHFTQVQQQLRQLGVTYSSLETLGDQGLYYRFHCRVAVGGDASLARQFQATGADPAGAMTSVLHQIQQWQAGL